SGVLDAPHCPLVPGNAEGAGSSFLHPGGAPTLRVHFAPTEDVARAPAVSGLALEEVAVGAGLTWLIVLELRLVDLRCVVLVAEPLRLLLVLAHVLLLGERTDRKQDERDGQHTPPATAE